MSDHYAACKKCLKCCCLNCIHFGGALELLPGQLHNITCHAQPEEKFNRLMGDKECAHHKRDDNNFKVVNKPIEGAV